MKKQIYFVIILMATLVLISCDYNTNDSEVKHLSSDRLSRIDTMINRYIDSGKLSGATVLISMNNKIGYLKSYGYNSIEDSIPMENNCIYGVSSMTKLITCVSALILYEQGYFKLNDQLSFYLPEFKNMKVYTDKTKDNSIMDASKPILIRDLFRHTSGIGYYSQEYTDAGADFNKVTSLAEFVQKLSTVPLYHEPGSAFDYSFSTDILGYLIEKLSGQSLREFFIENIFIPLKMEDTDFYVPVEKKDRLANYYNYINDSLIIIEKFENSAYKELPKIYSGGGGLVSTVNDYAKFLQMLLNYGKYNNIRILSRKTVELMKTDQLQNIDNKGFLSNGSGHGLGVALIVDAGQYGELFSNGTLYWQGYRNTAFFLDYQEKLFGILMTQMLPFYYLSYMDEYKILTYQAIDD